MMLDAETFDALGYGDAVTDASLYEAGLSFIGARDEEARNETKRQKWRVLNGAQACFFCGGRMRRNGSGRAKIRGVHACSSASCRSRAAAIETQLRALTMGRDAWLAHRRQLHEKRRAPCCDCGAHRPAGSHAKRCEPCLALHRRAISRASSARCRRAA